MISQYIRIAGIYSRPKLTDKAVTRSNVQSYQEDTVSHEYTKGTEAEGNDGIAVNRQPLGASATVEADPWPNAGETGLALRNGLATAEQESLAFPLTMRGLRGLSDEELMLACRGGRRDALDVLYERHYQPVFAFILRLVRDRQLAEDLVQETFLRVYGSRERWEPKSKFTSWMYRIARNLCIDEKRRYWNRLVQCDSDAPQGESGDLLSFVDTTEEKGPDARQQYTSKVHAEIIRRAIDSLSEDQREVIILNKYQGLSYIEISEILGVTPESIKQRAYRAHLKLRKMLKPVLEEYQ